VNNYIKEKKSGFIVANENPEFEYYFESSELQSKDGIQHVRTYTTVEFEVSGKTHNRAVQITKENGGRLSYIIAAQKKHNRGKNATKLLSDLEDRRHSGVVYNVEEEKKIGWIQPKMAGFQAVKFSFSDLNCTGMNRIRKDSEVEFRVAKRGGDKTDYAYDITRPREGLITYEIKELGVKRRILGQKYGGRDWTAELQHPERQRLSGTICYFDSEKLHGNIYCPKHPARNHFFYLDDCHIHGPRFLRHNQEVEFSIEQDVDGTFFRCSDITGPKNKVLFQWNENMKLKREQRTEHLKQDSGRHLGILNTSINPHDSKTYYGFITPVWRGKAEIFFPGQEIQATDRRQLPDKCMVEFEVDVNDKGNVYAKNITGPKKVPITTLGGPLGALYRIRNQTMKSIQPYDASPDEILQGVICRYNQSGTGLIEISSLDKRYSRVGFKRDAMNFSGKLPDRMAHWYVTFTIKDGEAVNINSVGESAFNPSRTFEWKDLLGCPTLVV